MEKQHWLDLLDEFLWFSVEEVLRAYTRLWRESEQSNHETSEPRLTLTATLYDGYQEADSKIPIKRVECAQGDLVETIKRLQSDAAFFRDRYVEYCSKVLDSDLNFPLQSAKCWLKKIYHLRNPKSAFKPKCVTLMNAYSSEVPKVLVWSRVLSEKDLAAFEETYVHVLLDVKDNPFGPLSQFAVNFPESVYAACKVGIIEQMEDVCLFEIACVPDCIETGEFTLRIKMEGTSGGEKEYLANIHSLRSKVLSVQTDIAECEKLYPVYTTEQGWTETEYQFTRCLEFLAEKNLKIISVDCEVRMLTLINDLRATGAEAELISFATQYWEKFHDVMQHINDIRNGYQSVLYIYTLTWWQVLSKLLLMFNNQMVFPTKTNTSLTAEYGRQVMQKMSTVESCTTD
ncbi:hypothetical protein EB796_008365 [Bugula neritina]|uniref:Uncharacterized protein n=1 Tax=Bugula neritina TaxID=10212 RepID=A0A7J7K3X3_BUGNE|nr:hypothetical protein EB796_008365 [Bugula neritina]